MLAGHQTTAFALLFCIVATIQGYGTEQHNRGDVSIEITSEPFAVWDTQDTKCNNYKKPLDLPDVPARAYVDNKGITHLITADTTTWISYGPSLLNVTRNCTIAYNATLNPDPSSFATNEFIDAAYSFGNGTVVALLHTEYPGMNYNNCNATKPSYPRCWTVTIGLAVSQDWGYSWSHARRPPHHLVAAVPYRYDPTGKDIAFGWGDTSGFVLNPNDGYFYTAAMNRSPVGLQLNGTCVFRTKYLLDPSSWRGWDGSSFSVKFANPYTVMDPTDHVCAVLSTIPSGCNMLGVTYSVYLELFVGSLWCTFEDGNIKNKVPFQYVTSPDMVHWSRPQQMFDPFSTKNPHLNFGSYPTLLDPLAPSARGDNNYQSIGQSATLFYVQVTHNFYKSGRQLMGVNVTFHKTETKGRLGSPTLEE